MTVYKVIYLNHYGEQVAEFGYYKDKLDAEKRVFDVKLKASQNGKVEIQDVFVHESSYETNEDKVMNDVYGFK